MIGRSWSRWMRTWATWYVEISMRSFLVYEALNRKRVSSQKIHQSLKGFVLSARDKTDARSVVEEYKVPKAYQFMMLHDSKVWRSGAHSVFQPNKLEVSVMA